MKLRRLTANDEKAFKLAISQWTHDPGFMFIRGYKRGQPFTDYLNILNDQENGKNIPDEWVPDTSLFAFLNDGTIVGRLSLRHQLNDLLLKLGGHIGYGVLMPYRGKGYATQMLRSSLGFAKDINLKKVLVTCDDDNPASAAVIVKCGGMLENIVDQANKAPKRRYWINVYEACGD